MAWEEGNPTKIELVTLGPTGTCHERAVIAYMDFQGVEDFEISYIGDFLDGLEIDRSPQFNGWLIAERRRFRCCHVALLEHMAGSAPGCDGRQGGPA